MKFNNLFLLIFLILIDQITKNLALAGEILFDAGLVSFNLVKNTGSSFGLFQGTNTVLIFISLIVLGGIIYYYSSLHENEKLWLMVATAGIIGNLIDRIWHGFVIDFIDFKVWPVFNIADSCIVIGVIFLIYHNWKNDQNSSVSSSLSK